MRDGRDVRTRGASWLSLCHSVGLRESRQPARSALGMRMEQFGVAITSMTLACAKLTSKIRSVGSVAIVISRDWVRGKWCHGRRIPEVYDSGIVWRGAPKKGAGWWTRTSRCGEGLAATERRAAQLGIGKAGLRCSSGSA